MGSGPDAASGFEASSWLRLRPRFAIGGCSDETTHHAARVGGPGDPLRIRREPPPGGGGGDDAPRPVRGGACGAQPGPAGDRPARSGTRRGAASLLVVRAAHAGLLRRRRGRRHGSAAMKLVAIARAPRDPGEAANVLAGASGLTLAETRMRLAPEPPALPGRVRHGEGGPVVASLRNEGVAAL